MGGEIIQNLTTPFPMSVSFAEAYLGEINTYRLVAVHENGTLLGGRKNNETGYFYFESPQYGEISIMYVPTLTRLILRPNSPEITCLAGNVPSLKMDVLPTVYNSRILLPVRFMAYSLGAEVDFSPASAETSLTVFLIRNEAALAIPIGETTAELTRLGMDTPAKIITGRTMVPLRFISEFFGAFVIWDEYTNTAEILTIG
jgi:hypothetical protein